MTGPNRACGYQWPLLPPEMAELRRDRVGEHRCGLLVGHAGPHRCVYDNEEVEP